MQYRIPFGAGRSAVPVRLTLRSGERLGGLLPGVDAASALVVAEAADGSYTQSFHPLNVRLHPVGSDPDDAEWALHGVRAGLTTWVYFLGVPSAFTFPQGPSVKPLRSLDVQIVGHSAFRSEGSFAGHATLAMGPALEPNRLPRFARFAEQWLPVLLPEGFVSAVDLTWVDDDGAQPVVTVALTRPEGEVPVPPALREDWDPAGWSDAVIETAAGGEGHALIRGGCFVSAEGRISHWFGGRIGLERRGFRARAAEQLRSAVARGSAHWCFWVEPVGTSELPAFAGGRVRVRHPAMGLAWNGSARAVGEAAALPAYRTGVEMLRDAAQLLARRHPEWERLRGSEAWRLWRSSAASSAEAPFWLAALESETAQFFDRHRALLGSLALAFAARPGEAPMGENPFAALAEFAAVSYRGKEAQR